MFEAHSKGIFYGMVCSYVPATSLVTLELTPFSLQYQTRGCSVLEEAIHGSCWSTNIFLACVAWSVCHCGSIRRWQEIMEYNMSFLRNACAFLSKYSSVKNGGFKVSTRERLKDSQYIQKHSMWYNRAPPRRYQIVTGLVLLLIDVSAIARYTIDPFNLGRHGRG